MPILACLIAIVISAGTLALSVHLITAPDHEPQRVAAASNVRQIPLGKTSDVSRGDPQNQLTPVYPAAPGKDLPPVAETANAAASADVAAKEAAVPPPASASAPASETTGAASTSDPETVAAAPPPAITPVSVSTAAAPNSCAIAACESAYRSFRASDCSYQPFEGPRKTCDLDANSTVQNASAIAAPSRNRAAVSRSRMRSEADELDEVERVVRGLPGPGYYDDARVIIIERPGAGYRQRRVIYRED